jgi:hypothetical protein
MLVDVQDETMSHVWDGNRGRLMRQGAMVSLTDRARVIIEVGI